MPTSTRTGAFYALGAFAVFSGHDVFVKHLGATYSPVQIVFFSVLFGFPLVTLMLLQDKVAENLIPRHPWWTLARTIATVVTGFCAFYAFSVLPLAQTYALLFAAPLVITVLSIPILGEKVRLRRGVAVLVGMVGVLIVLRPGAQEFSLGHAAALMSAFGGAFASVVVRKIGKDERNAVLLLYPMVANVLILGAALPLVYKPMPLDDVYRVGVVAICGFAATLLLINAYKRSEAVIVAPMQYSQIIWAVFWGFLLFHEVPDLPTLLGAGVIISSGLYIVLREAQPNASTQQPVLRTRSRPETGTVVRVSSFLKKTS